MQTIYIFSYPLRTLGWRAIILLLDLVYNEIRFRCLSKVLPIRYVPSVQMHRTPHNRRIAKVTVHNWRKLWTETGMSGRNSSNFHAERETVDTNNKKAMSETPRLRFCNTIYRLRAFSVLLEKSVRAGDVGVCEMGGSEYKRKERALKDFEQKKDPNSARSVFSYVIWTEMIGLSDNFEKRVLRLSSWKWLNQPGIFTYGKRPWKCYKKSSFIYFNLIFARRRLKVIGAGRKQQGAQVKTLKPAGDSSHPHTSPTVGIG